MKKFLPIIVLLVFAAVALVLRFAVFSDRFLPQQKATLTITSSSFPDGGIIPVKHFFDWNAANGRLNKTPQLSWKTDAKDVKSYALLMVDRHPFSNNFVHWCVPFIPSTIQENPEGTEKLEGAEDLFTSGGFAGYLGPNPPSKSHKHYYEIRILALNKENITNDVVEASGGHSKCTLAGFEKAVKGKVLAEGKYVGVVDADK